MKMKKMMFLMPVFLWGLSAGMNAQVTIGSSSEPAKSAVLDLNTGGSHDKGLLLPRLDLASATDISKLSAAPEIGLMVYATGDKTTPGDKKGLKEGVYSWDGVKWATGGGGSVGIPVTGITVNPTGIIFPATDSPTRTLAATVLPACANQAVTWESANPAIATVDENTGVVTPVAQGTTTITATSVDNESKTAGSLITVAPQVAVTGVSVNPTQCSFLAINETQLLTATVTPSWADNKAVNWYSSDDGIAEVDENGLVTAKGFGTATITVATVDGNHTATCAVDVMTHVASINLEPTSKNFTATGQTVVLSLQILPTTATNQMVNWVSSNKNVATVTQTDTDPSTGTITALVTATGLGTATITVTSQDGFHQATCAVSCYEAVTGIKINSYSYSNPIERVYKSSTLSVRATTIPANAYNKNVTWTTGDPSVATVSPENSTTTSTVTLQCVSHGTTTLKVTSEEDANFYDEVPVNCEMVVFAQDGTPVTTSPVSTSSEAVSLPCPSAFPTRMSFPSMTTLHGGVSASTWFRVFGNAGISHTTPPGMNYQSKADAAGNWTQSSVNTAVAVAWFCVE